MKPVILSEQASWRRDMASLLSVFTHDAANPLINLDSLVQYLQRQSDDLKAAVASNHSSNIEHLLDNAIPQTIEMMLGSSRKLHDMNTALNQLYHCHCDDLQDERLDLNSLVALEISKLKAPAHIQFEVANLPFITADADAMQAVFKAFISNAINSCVSDGDDNAPACISISCQQSANALRFGIQDQGCGIVDEEINKIFTPFYRGINSSGYGLGIGLCMAQALLNRYQSPIDCKSTAHQGSCFSFTWPGG